MDLAQLRRRRATVDVEYDGETCTVGYHPNAVSDEDVKLFASVSEKPVNEALAALIEPLARMVVDWDLTWDGEPMPPTAESIGSLPPLMRLAMFGVIVKHFFDRGNATASAGTSPAEAASGGTVLTTTASSVPPNGQASPHGLSLVSTTPPAG